MNYYSRRLPLFVVIFSNMHLFICPIVGMSVIEVKMSEIEVLQQSTSIITACHLVDKFLKLFRGERLTEIISLKVIAPVGDEKINLLLFFNPFSNNIESQIVS